MKILDKPNKFRELYVKNFINTDSEYFKNNLSSLYLKEYAGYLWDCLKNPEIIELNNLMKIISKFDRIFIISDLNGYGNKRFDRDKFTYIDINFPNNFVIEMSGKEFIEKESLFPEDIYLFDESYSWTFILTHEYIDQERYCIVSS